MGDPTHRTLPLVQAQLSDFPELSPSAFPAEEPDINNGPATNIQSNAL